MEAAAAARLFLRPTPCTLCGPLAQPLTPLLMCLPPLHRPRLPRPARLSARSRGREGALRELPEQKLRTHTLLVQSPLLDRSRLPSSPRPPCPPPLPLRPSAAQRTSREPCRRETR